MTQSVFTVVRKKIFLDLFLYSECWDAAVMFLTCYAGQLEVRGSREGHRWNSQSVNLRRWLHRGCVLRWGRKINLILKVVFKLLNNIYKSDFGHYYKIKNNRKYRDFTLKLISCSLQQETQLSSNTTRASSTARDKSSGTLRERSTSPADTPGHTNTWL